MLILLLYFMACLATTRRVSTEIRVERPHHEAIVLPLNPMECGNINDFWRSMLWHAGASPGMSPGYQAIRYSDKTASNGSKNALSVLARVGQIPHNNQSTYPRLCHLSVLAYLDTLCYRNASATAVPRSRYPMADNRTHTMVQ